MAYIQAEKSRLFTHLFNSKVMNIKNIQAIKQRFGIIGISDKLNRAIDIARQVAGTDLTVLIVGESGTGKEIFPKVIHQYSARKHNNFIAVNCGAIPEGTIDSELFGHEKGSFTGAHESRKGYFEVANKGTIFLDEVADLPLSTQVRLLRVLETGEFIRVGSSKVQKTDVRVVAATNVNIQQAIKEKKFREDLFYRLNNVPITMPALRERAEDVLLLFRKFAGDFAERYRMPPITLEENAQHLLRAYRWPGNIRQLKNLTEQISVIEDSRVLTEAKLRKYLSYDEGDNLPAVYESVDAKTFASEREILYKILFDMKQDMNDLKKLVYEIMQADSGGINVHEKNAQIINKVYQSVDTFDDPKTDPSSQFQYTPTENAQIEDTEEFVEESLSLAEQEIELIRKALEKHNGKRKMAAEELGISERTLYRKIKEYNVK